jgi:hypothetical protein
MEKKWRVLLTGGHVRSGQVTVLLTRWEVGFIRQLMLDRDPKRQSQASDDLWGKTTVATIYLQEKDKRRRRRQRVRTDVAALERMLDATGEKKDVRS